MTEDAGKIFDAHYYQTGCGRPYQRDEVWLQSFGAIADHIIQEINPKTVLDAGCAMGFLVESLRNRGVAAYGVDISEYAIQNVHPSIRDYCQVGSIAEPFPQKYDLIVTIEVLEHMPKAEAEKAVENLCAHTDVVLFSSGDQDFRETTHFNLQPPEYWAAQFARHGFFRDVDFDATFITDWSVCFRRSIEPVHRLIMGYERKVHRLVMENSALRQVNLDQNNLLGAKEAVIAQKDQEIAQREARIVEINNQLAAMVGSRTYQVARRMRMFVPQGSRREKFIAGVWQKLAGLRRQGLRGLFK